MDRRKVDFAQAECEAVASTVRCIRGNSIAGRTFGLIMAHMSCTSFFGYPEVLCVHCTYCRMRGEGKEDYGVSREGQQQEHGSLALPAF